MIRVFSPTDKVFSSNGDIVINNPIRAVVYKVDNGDYYLELTCGLEYIDYIKANNIIVVDTPQGAQAFRIQAPYETTRTKISVKAWHISYDSENYLISDSYVVNKNCNDALNHLNNATDNPSPFTVSSNISTINSYRCVRKSLFEAINVVLERWGGHIVRDNFNISVRSSIGTDNGVTIQYRKNLKEITVTEDWSGVCTKCLPVGKDGFTLPNLYMYSDIQYDIPYTKTVTFEQGSIERSQYPSDEAYNQALREDLIRQCEAYLNIAQYPSINYTLSANMEKITDIGDIVEVFDERLGVSLTATVFSFEYDCILGKYNSVEFGTPTASLGDLMSGISSEISASVSQSAQDITAILETAIEVAVGRIWETLGASYCVINGDEIYLLDDLPSEDAVNVIKMDNNGFSISFDGVNGTFYPFLTIDGDIDFTYLNVIGLTLDKILGGILTLGGADNENGEIYVNDSSDNELVVIDNLGIHINLADGSTISLNSGGLYISGYNLATKTFYKHGDLESFGGKISSGYINNNSEAFFFNVELPKDINNLSVSISELKLNAYTFNGSLFTYSSTGKDILADSSLTASIESTGKKYLTIKVEQATPFSVTANTPITIELVSLGLAFS